MDLVMSWLAIGVVLGFGGWGKFEPHDILLVPFWAALGPLAFVVAKYMYPDNRGD